LGLLVASVAFSFHSVQFTLRKSFELVSLAAAASELSLASGPRSVVAPLKAPHLASHSLTASAQL